MKLHLGCGCKIWDDYINVDCAYTSKDNSQNNYVQSEIIGYLEGLEDESVDEIRSEHFLEHLTRTQVSCLLYHSSRVLKNGGKFDVLIPEFDSEGWNKMYKNHFSNDPFVNQDAKLHHTAQIFYGCTDPDTWAEMHKLVYDRELLKHILSVYDLVSPKNSPTNNDDEIRITATKIAKKRNVVEYRVVLEDDISDELFNNVWLEDLGAQHYCIAGVHNMLPTHFSANAVLHKTWFGIRRSHDNQLVSFYDSQYYVDAKEIPQMGTAEMIPFATSANLRGNVDFDFSSLAKRRYNFSNGIILIKK